ncbi:MAG: hypothetical protein LC793_08670 [Thermomicrobia bacterium]|nr:hypothetical protein [Thermomicrobia bacterium]
MTPTIHPKRDPGMRRLFVAFFANFGICFIASFIIAIVAHIDGSSWVIYPLGALVVVPIPVMLVLLYFLIQRALADDPAGNALRRSGPVDAAVVAAAARSFPAADRAEALAILAAYGVGPDEPERTRVQLAIIHLSDGSLKRLQYFTDQAKQEYRDILSWDAEIATPDRK